jgi:hypothetical protein
MEMFKDVTIGEYKYRIGRFTARVGSWVLAQSSKGSKLTEQEFANLQDHCLAVCSRYETASNVPMPVMANGIFAIKELEYDMATVTKLQGHAMAFSFDDFLAEAAKEMKQALADTDQPSDSSNT